MRNALFIARFFNLSQKRLVGISTPYLLFKNGETYLFRRDAGEFESLSERDKSVAKSILNQLARSEKLITHKGLFFANNPLGTFYIATLLGGLFVVFLVIIPLIGTIERVILRRILGRFNLYNQLIEKVKSISLFGKE